MIYVRSRLVSFLASVFGVSGILVGLVAFRRSIQAKTAENEHRLIVELRSFEINNLEGIVSLGFHSDEKHIEVEKLACLYNDASESEVVKEKFAGSYDKIYSIVSLSREIDDGKYQAHVIFWFFIFVAVATFAVFVTW